MKKTLFAAVVALSCAVFAPAEAEACGPYGPPTAEQVATSTVWAAVHRAKLSRYVSLVTVDLTDATRGTATIYYRRGAKRTVRLTKSRGRWVVRSRASRSRPTTGRKSVQKRAPRRQPVKRAVAAS